MRRLCIGGSLIGGIKETQDMLDLCGEKGITCDVEVRWQRCVSLLVAPGVSHWWVIVEI